MPDKDETAAAQADADELAKKRQRTKAARASRNKIVGHVAQLTAPCTLYRMQGSGAGKANRMWVADLPTIPTVSKVQKRYGGGRFVLVDCNSDRFQFNLAALPDEPDEPEPEPEPETAGHYTPGPHQHQPGPRFDPMTGRALQPHPGWGPEVAQGVQPPPRFDPMTGRPIPAAPWGGYGPQYGSIHQRADWPPPAYHRPQPAPQPAPQGESAGLRLLLDEVRSLRAQAIERPIPAASDFGGQMTAMFTAFDLLDKMKNRFAPGDGKNDDDADDEPAWMAIAEKFLPMLMPQAPPTAPPALAPPPPQQNPATTQPPLSGDEVQSARQMMAPLMAIAPAMTLEKLCELGERAGIAHRQSVHLFHGVMGVLNGGSTTAAAVPEPVEEFEDEEEYSEEEEGESWSEEESSDAQDDQAPEPETPAAPTPLAPTSLAPPSNGPEPTPAGPKPASGPLDNSPPLPTLTNETTRAVG